MAGNTSMLGVSVDGPGKSMYSYEEDDELVKRSERRHPSRWKFFLGDKGERVLDPEDLSRRF